MVCYYLPIHMLPVRTYETQPKIETNSVSLVSSRGSNKNKTKQASQNLGQRKKKNSRPKLSIKLTALELSIK